METLRIKINKLGAVTDSEIELRPFLLFTGESGLGKSYVSFLAHYVYAILGSDRLKYFFDKYNIKDIIANAKPGDNILSISSSDLFEWLNKDAISYIGYMIGNDDFQGDVNIEWPFDDTSIDFSFNEEMSGLANKEDVIYRLQSKNFSYRYLTNNSDIDPNGFYILVRAELTQALFGEYKDLYKEYILPPSRGALMELSEKQAFRSGMYLEFFKLKDSLITPATKKKDEDSILSNLLQQVNHGTIISGADKLNYVTDDGIQMPLTAAASSVKELAPFTLLLNKFNLDLCSILLEEPEAHLHPERQNYVADLIGYVLSRGCHLQITTHSDYFIKRLNLLVNLYVYSQQDSTRIKSLLEELNISHNALINPNDIKAYFLQRADDNTSRIIELNVLEENGIPFASFEKTILDYFNALDLIHKYKEESGLD